MHILVIEMVMSILNISITKKDRWGRAVFLIHFIEFRILNQKLNQIRHK